MTTATTVQLVPLTVALGLYIDQFVGTEGANSAPMAIAVIGGLVARPS